MQENKSLSAISRLLILFSCPLLFLNGCLKVGPDYKPPEIKQVADWSVLEFKHMDSNLYENIQWWESFNDELFTLLIGKAIQNNIDIKIAETNILQARALNQASKAGIFPQLGSSANNEYIKFDNSNNHSPLKKGKLSFFNAGFDASWELDIFGKNKRAIEASAARTEATIANKDALLITIMAETAKNYIDAVSLRKTMILTQENIDYQRQLLKINEKLYNAGETDSLDLNKSQKMMNLLMAKLPLLEAEFMSLIYKLHILTAESVEDLKQQILYSQTQPTAPDIINIGIRSDVLKNRPDVLAAERILAAETADIGVAKANFFPSFALIGNLGELSLNFGDLFKHTGVTWKVSSLMKWPLFTGGKVQAQIKYEKAEAKAAALNYEKTVVTALADADNALTSYLETLIYRMNIQEATKNHKKELDLMQQRYQQGEDSIAKLLIANIEYNQSIENLIDSNRKVSRNLIGLYKALGGGWKK
jgi:NodT family efflux transporter outer membrane factor (OMF) lipoprotein